MLATKFFEKHLSKELARKIIHIVMGISVMSLPFILDNRWSIIPLFFIALAVLLFLRHHKKYKQKIASPLFAVDRTSYGEIYFILAVGIIFLRYQHIVEYLIPISILTFADSVAALVGVKYGQGQISVQLEDTKSSEGSVMFFITAFICTLIPLQLLSTVGRAEVLLISFLIGVLAAMIEAISLNGQDNFLLPLLTYSFLVYNMPKSTDELLISFVYMLIFVLIAIIIYKFTTISKLSAAHAILIGYIILIQGGIMYLIPPLLLFVGFGILPKRVEAEKNLILPSVVIKCNAVVGICCLFINSILPEYEAICYLAYSLSFACHLTINTYNRFINFLTPSKKKALKASIYKTIFLMIIPVFVLYHFTYKLSIFTALYFLFCWALYVPITYYLCNNYNYKIVDTKTIRLNESTVGAVTALYFGGMVLYGLL